MSKVDFLGLDCDGVCLFYLRGITSTERSGARGARAWKQQGRLCGMYRYVDLYT